MKIGNFYPEEEFNIATDKISVNDWNYKGNQTAVRVLSILNNCFRNSDFSDIDFYAVGDFEQSFLYNRDNASFLLDGDYRGMMSINLDHSEHLEKKEVDVLIPNHGVGIVSKIKGSQSLINRYFREFTVNNVIDIILKNGGNLNRLTRARNDLFYNGKKFFGNEIKATPDGMAECSVITCEYLPEKENFAKLRNCKNNITGITEEVPSVTKQLLIDELIFRITRLVKNL